MAARGVLRLCVLLALLPAGARAQDAPPLAGVQDAGRGGDAASAILTVDQEALFRQSAWGQRAIAALADQTRRVAADNDRLFAQLSAEEAALTELRKTLPAAEFRARATAFDERVTRLRREREAAARELQQLSDAERGAFFRAAAPVIGTVMRERGALVVLDPRTVLFSVEAIDVTATVVARIDAEIGDGAGVVDLSQQSRDTAATPPSASDPAAADAPMPPVGLPAPAADAAAPSAEGPGN